MATWQCIQHCGACCNLDPGDRPDLADYLSPEELATYLGMVGPDGWCIHFETETRSCQIYDQRPGFCRVSTETFRRMFGLEPQELNDFAIECCRDQIEGVYGNRSLEQVRFEQTIGLKIV
ncbi:MAG: YkgJ family cysteine cluster protein [Cyanobacteria bacterium P01_F01_bin.42]